MKCHKAKFSHQHNLTYVVESPNFYWRLLPWNFEAGQLFLRCMFLITFLSCINQECQSHVHHEWYISADSCQRAIVTSNHNGITSSLYCMYLCILQKKDFEISQTSGPSIHFLYCTASPVHGRWWTAAYPPNILFYFTFIQVRQFRLPVNFQFHCWPDSRVKQSKNYTRNWSLGNLGEWMTIHISTEWEMSPHCLHQNQAYVLWHYHWL